MRSVSLRLVDLSKSMIPIGFVDENLHTQVRIDCKKMFEEYPEALPSLTVSPPEGSAYPAIVTKDGDYVVWDITSSDCASEGTGEIQLTFVVGEIIAKSYIGRIRVTRSLNPAGEIPDPVQDWITQANAVLAEIPETISTNLQEIFEEAKESGELKGDKGDKGDPGNDGYTPVKGVDYFDGEPGQPGTPGQDGAPGQDGFSPDAAISKSGTVATITITDKNGTTTATISDGEDGLDGDDGEDGEDGVTFTPSVSAEGVISWTNDGGRTNPASVNIKGPKGDTGDPAPAEDVADAVDEWLEDNFSNPSNPPLDRSLSSALSAAPADLVGDLKSEFNALYDDETNATITEAGIYACPLYKNHVYFVSLDVTTLFNGNIYTQVASIGAVAETVGNINAIISSNGKLFAPTVDTGYIKITDTSSATGNIDVVFTDISAAITSYKRAASIARLFDVGTLYGKESFVFGMDGDLYFLPDGHAKNVTWENTTKTKVLETDMVRQLLLQMDSILHDLPFDLNIINGGYCNTGGSISSHDNYQYSVIEYNGIDDVVVTTNANSVARIAIYYSDAPGTGTIIGSQDADYPASYGTLSVTDFKLTIPEGTKYIAINNIKNAGSVSAKRITSEYVYQKISEILSNLLEVDDSLYAYVNVTNDLTIQSGKYYRVGGDIYEHQDYETTVISVTRNDHFKVTCAGNSLCPCVMYFTGEPSSSTLISYEPTTYPASYGTKVIKEYEVTIPSNAKYMVVNNRPNDADLTVWKKQIAEVSETMLSYQGKNILLLGDSITQLNLTARGWPKYFSQIVKPARMDNVAVIGAHWCDYNNSTVYNGNPQADSTEQNVVGNQVQKIINNPSDYAESYDVIIIAAGTNDPTSTGEISTSEINAQFFSGSSVKSLNNVDRSTWAGATRWITEKLRGLFPKAKIIFNTPIHRIDMYDCSRVLNNGACVKRCADVNGVLLCDTLHCGITMTDSSYFVDLLHPSVKGAKLIGAYNAKFFVNMFTGYLDE